MARHGERKSQKRISVETARFLKRKENVWTIRTKPGPHRRGHAIPLGFVARDMLQVGQTMFEAKKVLNQLGIEVNGVARKDTQFAVGLFDVVGVKATKKKFRVVFDKKGRLTLNEMDAKSPLEKVSKVLFKKAVKGGLIQLTTSEGFVFRDKKTGFSPNDSVKISVPEKKILSGLKFEEGNMVYFIGGTKIGETGKIRSITAGTRNRPVLVEVEVEGAMFKTTGNNLMVIGEKSAAVDLGKMVAQAEGAEQ
ncbi:MAG: 30S ribosomal protein S4e [archaeon]|nr:30S ribosomal protein S4e [archaeon]